MAVIQLSPFSTHPEFSESSSVSKPNVKIPFYERLTQAQVLQNMFKLPS